MKIIDYVKKNPMCSAKDIFLALDVSSYEVGRRLSRLEGVSLNKRRVNGGYKWTVKEGLRKDEKAQKVSAYLLDVEEILNEKERLSYAQIARHLSITRDEAYQACKKLEKKGTVKMKDGYAYKAIE